MVGPKKLLIAVDGSQQSLEAVSYVALNFPPSKPQGELDVYHSLSARAIRRF